LVIQIFRFDGSGIVGNPQLVHREPTRKGSKSTKTPIRTQTLNFINAASVGILKQLDDS
jgi:hypothetical protein